MEIIKEDGADGIKGQLMNAITNCHKGQTIMKTIYEGDNAIGQFCMCLRRHHEHVFPYSAMTIKAKTKKEDVARIFSEFNRSKLPACKSCCKELELYPIGLTGGNYTHAEVIAILKERLLSGKYYEIGQLPEKPVKKDACYGLGKELPKLKIEPIKEDIDLPF